MPLSHSDPPSPALAAPTSSLLGEVTGVIRGLTSLPGLKQRLAQLPHGKATPVLTIPGFMTGDPALALLRAFLRGLDYRAYPVGFWIGGDVERLIPRVQRRLDELYERHGEAVALVGWSMGGTLARAVSRLRPERVSQIVTLGTPVVGGPRYTRIAGYHRLRGVDLAALEAQVASVNRTPLPRPVTAIYSRRDAIVAWQACLDPNPDNTVNHVEVQASHGGLCASAEAFTAIALALAPAASRQ